MENNETINNTILETSGGLMRVKRNGVILNCHLQPFTPVPSKLGGIEFIKQICSNACPHFHIKSGLSKKLIHLSCQSGQCSIAVDSEINLDSKTDLKLT